MKRATLGASLITLGTLVAGAVQPSFAAPAPAPLVGADSPDVIAGEYVVVLKDTAGLRAAGVETDGGDDELVADAVARSRRIGADVTQRYTNVFDGYAARMDAGELARVRTDSAVAYVQANQRYQATGTLTQDEAPWGLDRIDQRGRTLNGKYSFGATGTGVTAYVVDTGVRGSHLDFTTNLEGDAGESRVRGGISKISGDSSTEDCLGHGTHVAGTIGGTYYGVAKEVTIVPIRVLNCRGSSSSSIVAQGLDWIVAHHTSKTPAVANLSLTNERGADPVVEAAVNRVIKDGVTTVIAAGNGVPNAAGTESVGIGACDVSPSRVRAAITVGATSRRDARAGFSNYGTCVDLYAPGVDIESDSYLADNQVVEMSGTSMAAPHVAGAAALYLQAHPTATPAQVHSALIAASTPDVVTNVSAKWPRRVLFSLPKVAKPAATTASDAVTSGTALLRGSTICSTNGKYCLTQRKSDGKLVLATSAGKQLWTSNKAAAWTKMNKTGNFASYDAYGQPVWSTKTSGVGESTLSVTNAGKLILASNASGAVEWTN